MKTFYSKKINRIKKKLKKQFKNGMSGFTIMELIVVMAVIGVLMGIVFAGGSVLISNSKKMGTYAEIRNAATGLKTGVEESIKITTYTYSDSAYEDGDSTVMDFISKYISEEININSEVFYYKSSSIDSSYTEMESAVDSSLVSNYAIKFDSTTYDQYGNTYNVYWTFADTNKNHAILIVSDGANRVSTADDIIGVLHRDSYGVIYYGLYQGTEGIDYLSAITYDSSGKISSVGGISITYVDSDL